MATRLRIGYLGPEGTFSDEALRRFLVALQLDAEQLPYPQILSLFRSSGDCDAVIVPLENSIEGPVTIAVDEIIQYPHLTIVHEVNLPIQQALMVRLDFEGEIQKIEAIFSHPQPLAQCGDYIASRYPTATLYAKDSTATAAQFIVEHPGAFAVIGSEILAGLYGLKVLDKNIQDHTSNTTRFVVICDPQNPRCQPLLSVVRCENATKTSLVFTTDKNTPGSLVAALTVFAKRQINMMNIASRPAKTSLGEYLFWVDIETPPQADFEAALAELRMLTKMVKILGTYPTLDL